MLFSIIETIIIFVTLGLSFWWVQSGYLNQTYLPVMIAVILGYFIAKRLQAKIQKKDVWFRKEQEGAKNLTYNLAPELVLIGVIVMIVITFFGGFNSPILPLIYFYLFFLVFLLPNWSSAIIALEISCLFFWSTPQFLASNWANLLSIPIFWALIIFAKKQYLTLLKESQELAIEKEKVKFYNQYAEQQQAISLTSYTQSKNERTSLIMVRKFWWEELIPKIAELQKLALDDKNQLVVQSQLMKLNFRLSRLGETFFGKNAPKSKVIKNETINKKLTKKKKKND